MATFPDWLFDELDDRLRAAAEAIDAIVEPHLQIPKTNARAKITDLQARAAELREQEDRGEACAYAFRSLAREFGELEQVQLAFLLDLSESALRMTALAARLAQQIGLVDVAPVVSTIANLSQFQTFSKHAMISVPVGRRERLLTMPIIAHELGHTLYVQQLSEVNAWIGVRARRHYAEHGASLPMAKVTFEQSWRGWAMELSCDFVAIFTCGAAHLRALLMLAAAGEATPFRTGDRHPPEHVRVMAAITTLKRHGAHREATELEDEWQTLLDLHNLKSVPAGVDRACPPEMVAGLLDQLEARTNTLGLVPFARRPSGGVADAAAEAFEQQRTRPATYGAWERRRVAELLSS